MYLTKPSKMRSQLEVATLKAKLNIGSELVGNIRQYLIYNEITEENKEALKEYVSDLSEFLETM